MDSPKTPDPIIMMDDGGSYGVMVCAMIFVMLDKRSCNVTLRYD